MAGDDTQFQDSGLILSRIKWNTFDTFQPLEYRSYTRKTQDMKREINQWTKQMHASCRLSTESISKS